MVKSGAMPSPPPPSSVVLCTKSELVAIIFCNTVLVDVAAVPSCVRELYRNHVVSLFIISPFSHVSVSVFVIVIVMNYIKT